MDHVTDLECTLCGETYDPNQIIYTCPEHQGVKGILEVNYDYDLIQERFDCSLDGSISDMWKYEAFLPVARDSEPVSLDEGGTELLRAPNLSEELGVAVSVKDDGRNPTGCLKDRATSVTVTRAMRYDREIVTCASTGNAAASLAGYAARAGIDARIFVPSSAPEGKLAQPLVYGADVLAVKGSYDEAYDLSLEVTDQLGWYNRNAAINPFQVEGKRTARHEIAEQTAGEVPDWVVVSMGDGCTIHGVWKGMREFQKLGFVEETPRMLGVQPEGASAIHEAFHGFDEVSEVAETIADSVAVARPRNTVKACRELEESGGESVLVSDSDILDAEKTLGSTEEIYAEPAGAAPIAGLRTAIEQGIVDPDDRVVVVVTGNGLKDAESAQSAGGEVDEISPEMHEVTRLHGDETA